MRWHEGFFVVVVVDGAKARFAGLCSVCNGLGLSSKRMGLNQAIEGYKVAPVRSGWDGVRWHKIAARSQTSKYSI